MLRLVAIDMKNKDWRNVKVFEDPYSVRFDIEIQLLSDLLNNSGFDVSYYVLEAFCEFDKESGQFISHHQSKDGHFMIVLPDGKYWRV